MPIDLELEAAGRTTAARAIFARLDGAGYVNLPILTGADLCLLGGPRHPFCWEPLAAAWLTLRPQDRDGYIRTRTRRMIEDGRLIETGAGDGGVSGARYAVSPELGILLAARSRPTFAIASHFSLGVAPLTLLAVGDEAEPVRGIVMAVPATPLRQAGERAASSPLAGVFDHLLTTAARAAEFLADRVIRPAPADSEFHEQPHHLVTLYRSGDGLRPAARLSVLGNGTTARVTGAGLSGEFDREMLQTVLLRLFAQGRPRA
jgi:hypothetical protein